MRLHILVPKTCLRVTQSKELPYSDYNMYVSSSILQKVDTTFIDPFFSEHNRLFIIQSH